MSAPEDMLPDDRIEVGGVTFERTLWPGWRWRRGETMWQQANTDAEFVLDALSAERAARARDAQLLAHTVAERDRAVAALELLMAEVALSGNATARDFGWPAAVQAARDVLDAARAGGAA